jgi:hypothetical protein
VISSLLSAGVAVVIAAAAAACYMRRVSACLRSDSCVHQVSKLTIGHVDVIVHVRQEHNTMAILIVIRPYNTAMITFATCFSIRCINITVSRITHSGCGLPLELARRNGQVATVRYFNSSNFK